MKKNEFVQMIKDTEYCADISKKDIEAVINGISDAITEVIAQEDSVKLGSVGTFSGFTRPAKDMRNPRDGSTVHVPEKHGFPKSPLQDVNMKTCRPAPVEPAPQGLFSCSGCGTVSWCCL